MEDGSRQKMLPNLEKEYILTSTCFFSRFLFDLVVIINQLFCMIFTLPSEIKDIIFSYLNIAKRHGRYVKMLKIEDYTTIKDMLFFQQANTTKILLVRGIIMERVLFRDELLEIKVFQYDDKTWIENSNELFLR